MVEASPAPTQQVAVEATGVGGCERFRPLVAKYNWNIDIAMAVMNAESGCRETAVGNNTNGTNDKGLFQINSIHDATDNRFDPARNIELAYRIYESRSRWDTSGWKAWSVCLSGKVQCY